MDLEGIMQNEKSQTEKDKILYDLIYMWNLKKKKTQTTPTPLATNHRVTGKIIRHVVTRGGRWGMRELEESSQKVQISSYKINKYQGYNQGYNVQHYDYS